MGRGFEAGIGECGQALVNVIYLLFYRWHEDTIEVLRIKHGMMDLPQLFGGKPPAE